MCAHVVAARLGADPLRARWQDRADEEWTQAGPSRRSVACAHPFPRMPNRRQRAVGRNHMQRAAGLRHVCTGLKTGEEVLGLTECGAGSGDEGVAFAEEPQIGQCDLRGSRCDRWQQTPPSARTLHNPTRVKHFLDTWRAPHQSDHWTGVQRPPAGRRRPSVRTARLATERLTSQRTCVARSPDPLTPSLPIARADGGRPTRR